MNRNQRRRLKRKICNEKKQYLKDILLNNPPVQENLRQKTRFNIEEKVRLLLTKDDPHFKVKCTNSSAGLGVYYEPEEENDLEAHTPILVYTDWMCSYRHESSISKKRLKFSCYLLNTDLHNEHWTLDGTNSDRVGPKINHSKRNPNLIMKKIMIDNKCVVYFVTIRAITKYEQLFYDYLQNTKPTMAELKSFPWLDS